MSEFWLGFTICALICSPFLTYLGLFQYSQIRIKREMGKIRDQPQPEVVIDDETQSLIAEAEAALQQATG